MHAFRDYDKVKIFKVGVKQRGQTQKGLLHDKLILIQRASIPNIVVIESAGFSIHVQDNLNYENLLQIIDIDVYTFFHDHFDRIVYDHIVPANSNAKLVVTAVELK